MADMVNFPGQENIAERMQTRNSDFIENVMNHMLIEQDAICRTGNEGAIESAKDIFRIVAAVTDIIKERCNNTDGSTFLAPMLVTNYMQAVASIFNGGVLSPITGNDEEWIDTTDESDIGKTVSFKFRGHNVEIVIESVQVNKRYPHIYRLNNDNRLAHRIDFVQFHDYMKPEIIRMNEESIRFIQFPYDMKGIHVDAVIEEDKIVDLVSHYWAELENNIIFPDMESNDFYRYIIASKIPYHMLEEYGYSLEEEIKSYIESIGDIESGFDDEEDDDE